MVCAVHAPNLFPYYGLFKKIVNSDVFVFLDDSQMPPVSKLGYLNKVGMNIHGIEQWIQIPLKNESYIKVKDIEFTDDEWRREIQRKIYHNYCTAKYFAENENFVFNTLLSGENNLAKYNINAIIKFCLYFEIERKFGKSSDVKVEARKMERMALITKKFDCDTYLCGVSGEGYKDNSEFSKYDVKLKVNNYKPIEYEPNKSLGLSNGLSIIDILFRVGRVELSKQLKAK